MKNSYFADDDTSNYSALDRRADFLTSFLALNIARFQPVSQGEIETLRELTYHYVEDEAKRENEDKSCSK